VYVQPDRITRAGGKRTGHTQKLPAVFAMGAVYFAHSDIILHRSQFRDQLLVRLKQTYRTMRLCRLRQKSCSPNARQILPGAGGDFPELLLI